MKLYLIAVFSSNGKDVRGFRILDLDTGDMSDFDYAKVYNVLAAKKVKVNGIELGSQKGELKGSNGSFLRYPMLDSRGNIRNKSLVILNTVDSVGYQVSSFNGKIGYATRKDTVAFAERNGIANGKVVEKDGRKYISAISGTYGNVPYEKTPMSKSKKAKMLEDEKRLAADIQMRNRAKQYSSGYFPPIVSSLECDPAKLKQIDDVTGLSVEQKMTYAMMGLKQVRPFCYSVYNCLNRIPSDNVPTLSVTLRILYYNPDYILTESVADLLFDLIHEIYHISMKHAAREGTRNHKLWNYACDYYINSEIASEFGLKKLGDIAIAEQTAKRKNQVIYKISLPLDCIYNSNVDVDKDTPETIYIELDNIRQKKQQRQQDKNGQPMQNESGQGQKGQQGQQGQQGQGQQGQGQQGQGQGQQGQGQQGQGQGQQGQGQQGQGQGQQGQGQGQQGQGQGQNGNGQRSQSQGSSSAASWGDKHEDPSQLSDDLDDLANGGDGKQGQRSQSGDLDQGESDSAEGTGEAGGTGSKTADGSGSGSSDPDDISGEQFRGAQIPDKEVDMVKSEEEAGETSDRVEQILNSILKRAASIHRQENGSFGGEMGSFIERVVEEELAPKVKWMSILKNKLTKASQRINTFAAPDKRFRSRNMIMPGPKKIENDTLENVKICIDTSGSISNTDIGIALAQIMQLFKQFHADAELIYWDTQVRAVYPFDDPIELVNKKPLGGGGTDANCIFKYFEETREYKIGIKKKPEIIIVFTDGYFGEIEKKYHKYKGTIWVISGEDYKRFEPPFGSVAQFKVD